MLDSTAGTNVHKIRIGQASTNTGTARVTKTTKTNTGWINNVNIPTHNKKTNGSTKKAGRNITVP